MLVAYTHFPSHHIPWLYPAFFEINWSDLTWRNSAEETSDMLTTSVRCESVSGSGSPSICLQGTTPYTQEGSVRFCGEGSQKKLVGTKWNEWSDSVERTGVGFRQQADSTRHGDGGGRRGGVFIQALCYCITKTSQLMLFREIICLFESITKYINMLWATRSDFLLKQVMHIFTAVL
jgi:hypothetical protein